MPSMTLMMSTTFFDDSLIEAMVSTTRATTSPPRAAVSEADSASWLACWALSAFWRTVLVSSSIEAAVSSSALACSSVRLDRSLLPWLISWAAMDTLSELVRTRVSTDSIFATKPLKPAAIKASSSLPRTSRRAPRSALPLARPVMVLPSTRSGWVRRRSTMHMTMAAAMAHTTETSSA